MKTWFLSMPSFALVALTLSAGEPRSNAPLYTSDGQLIRPDNYREWVFLSAGLGMTYGTANQGAEPRFDNVFVNPEAYKSFLQTGTWPDKTVFILEVRSSATNGSINKGGHYQDKVTGIEAHVKDASKFTSTKWGFFQLGASDSSAKPLPSSSSCQKCHEKNGAVDETFVQFYPTLIAIAKANGTYKSGTEN